MRVLLSTYDSRGGVEPLVGLAARLRRLGAQVRACVPPDEEFAERLAGFGVPVVPIGTSVRALLTRDGPPSPAQLPRFAAELVAAQFETLTVAAEGCDALVASGVTPAGHGRWPRNSASATYTRPTARLCCPRLTIRRCRFRAGRSRRR